MWTHLFSLIKKRDSQVQAQNFSSFLYGVWTTQIANSGDPGQAKQVEKYLLRNMKKKDEQGEEMHRSEEGVAN